MARHRQRCACPQSKPHGDRGDKNKNRRWAGFADRQGHTEYIEPTKSAEAQESTQPLAPPPRPASKQDQADYFSGSHNANSHFSREPNPFERSFGQPSEGPDTKSVLPSVAALTSPAPLPQDGLTVGGYNFLNSLRSSPLSPAMLGGPVAPSGTDYFDPALRGTAYPGVTATESSLRTGLTPGGGGSMFPASSPTSQAFLQSLQNGGATPSTVDFHRAAGTAASSNKSKHPLSTSGTVPTESTGVASVANMDPTLSSSGQPNAFGQHDNDAANGLFLLAQATNEHNNNMQGRDPSQDDEGRRNASGQKVARRKAIGSSDDERSNKKARLGGPTMTMDDESDDQRAMQENKGDEYHADGRKMTEEEKRKNFLERNRVAALKCRQRKKQWLHNLQSKVDLFSVENDNLNATVVHLREEIVNLKTLLLQHKDCPISQNPGVAPPSFYQQTGVGFDPRAAPYGMSMPAGAQASQPMANQTTASNQQR